MSKNPCKSDALQIVQIHFIISRKRIWFGGGWVEEGGGGGGGRWCDLDNGNDRIVGKF